MPAGISAPEPATIMVVLSPSMSSQIRWASANWRPPKPAPSIFSSRPATERSRSTWTGRVGVVRYFDALGFRCVTIALVNLSNCKRRACWSISELITLEIRAPARAGFGAINRKIGVGVVTRLIKLRQIGAFGFGQFTVLDALADQAAETVVQQALFVARAFGCLAHGRAAYHLLDQVAFVVDVDMRFV